MNPQVEITPTMRHLVKASIPSEPKPMSQAVKPVKLVMPADVTKL